MKYVYLEDSKSLCARIDKDNELDFIKEKERFKGLFENISFPITLVVEECYSDRDYKDSYYHFFASKYRNLDKYTHRIAIFGEKIDENNLYDKTLNLESYLIGVITIRPLNKGCIGKTLFNPKKLKLKKAFIRSTEFELG